MSVEVTMVPSADVYSVDCSGRITARQIHRQEAAQVGTSGPEPGRGRCHIRTDGRNCGEAFQVPSFGELSVYRERGGV